MSIEGEKLPFVHYLSRKFTDIGSIGSQTGFVGSQTINGPHILIISGRHFAPIIGWQGLTTIFGPHISTLSLTGAQKSTLKSSFD